MAQNFGAEDHRGLFRSPRTSVTLCVISAAVLLLGSQLAAEPVLRLLNAGGHHGRGAALSADSLWRHPGDYGPQFAGFHSESSGRQQTPLYAMIVAALIKWCWTFCLSWAFIGNCGRGGGHGDPAHFFPASTVFGMWGVSPSSHLEEETSSPPETDQDSLEAGLSIALQNTIISVGGMVVQAVIIQYGMLFIAEVFTATNKLYRILKWQLPLTVMRLPLM